MSEEKETLARGDAMGDGSQSLTAVVERAASELRAAALTWALVSDADGDCHLMCDDTTCVAMHLTRRHGELILRVIQDHAELLAALQDAIEFIEDAVPAHGESVLARIRPIAAKAGR